MPARELSYLVDFKGPEELWNPLSETILRKYISISNKGPVKSWNDHKAPK